MNGFGNCLDYGARIYDSRIARWLSVDPNQLKYPSWSPYNSFNDCPIFIIDPTGRGGEASFDPNSGEIVIKLEIKFYGKSTVGEDDQLLAKETAASIQAGLNQNAQATTMIGPDGNPHPIRFEVTGSTVTNQSALGAAMENSKESSFNPALNFMRITNQDLPKKLATNTTAESDKSGGLNGDNSAIIESGHLKDKTPVHEVSHFLISRSLPLAHFKSNGEQTAEGLTVLSIQATFTDDPCLALTNPDGTPMLSGDGRTYFADMDLFGQVLISDILNMYVTGHPMIKLRDVKKTDWKDGKLSIGGSTNVLFDSSGHEIDAKKARKDDSHSASNQIEK